MSNIDPLEERFPRLSSRLPRISLASLPTPVSTKAVYVNGSSRALSIKYDNLTGRLYGGNKVRKLEYIFPRANERRRTRVATFGAAGSNHALATALYARKLGFDCTCFLSHQAPSPLVAQTLIAHLKNGTDLVRFGGTYQDRLKILRDSLWQRDTWIIPMGGSSWLGTIGYVTAGLELAVQIARDEIPTPDKLFVGSGTMGTAAGLAIGLALAGLHTEVNAVRVTDRSIGNPEALQRLIDKTVAMMRRIDPSIPVDVAHRTRIRLRDEFFGSGYAVSTPEAEAAIEFAGSKLGLSLEATYTGKTLAALLSDIAKPGAENFNLLYWHTYNSVPIDVPGDQTLAGHSLPSGFERYLQS